VNPAPFDEREEELMRDIIFGCTLRSGCYLVKMALGLLSAFRIIPERALGYFAGRK